MAIRLLEALFGRRKSTQNVDKPTPKSHYRAVEICADYAGCCQAARDLDGQKFLSNKVPKLPLEGCDAAECSCTYRLFDDRRSEVRRTSDLSFDIVGQYHQQEKRDTISAGRRRDD